MRIGLGIVVHNRLDIIKKCIPTVLAEKPDWIVIVDNNSEFETIEYLQSLVQSINIKILYNEKNHYAGYARNQIVEILKNRSDLIIFHDSDIIVPKGCFNFLKIIFSNLERLGQISPLPIPTDFKKNKFFVQNVELYEPISCCPGGMTAVRSILFRKGLKWRNIRWEPKNNHEIGEDYFLSRDVMSMGYRIAWFSKYSKYCCVDLGREPALMEKDFEYYLRTFGERGMLSRLKSRFPNRRDEIELYQKEMSIPELHDVFSFEKWDFCTSALPNNEIIRYKSIFENNTKLFMKLEKVTRKLENWELQKLKECRDYFDSIEDGHPLFSQSSLQAALFFSRLYIKNGGPIPTISKL